MREKKLISRITSLVLNNGIYRDEVSGTSLGGYLL
jgi:hypothetical protein